MKKKLLSALALRDGIPWPPAGLPPTMIPQRPTTPSPLPSARETPRGDTPHLEPATVRVGRTCHPAPPAPCLWALSRATLSEVDLTVEDL